MDYIDEQLIKFKNKLEEAILKDSSKGKESIIRLSEWINFIHDAVKFELIKEGTPLGKTKPELKIAGFLKQKKHQSIGRPLKYNNKIDKYGIEYSTLNFKDFAKDILKIYKNRYNLCNLLK